VSARLFLGPLLGLLVAGCAELGFVEPELRDGQWRPTGANEANLREMVDRPQDLERGRGVSRTDARAAAAAVERYRDGRVRPLPSVNTAPTVVGAPAAGGGP
jgi:hypothetical protein